MKKLLPIGSVVLLKGGTKRLMVCGRIQTKIDDDVTYDYSGCYFPEGFINAKELFLFNNENIEMVYFIGLQDVEEFKFRDYIEQKLKELKHE